MNIVDTNGINYIFGNNLTLQEEYFLAPDIVDEVELTQLILNRRLPRQILEITLHPLFNERIYLNYYNRALNKYGGRSFFNMTGFGDVSIMDTLHMFVEIFQTQNSTQLFDTTEQIIVYTDDRGLTTKIGTEFSGKDIHVRSINAIR